MIQNLKVLSRLKGVLLFLLIAIGIYFLFIKKDKTIEVSKKDPSQVKKKAALKRGIASVSEDPLKAKNFKKIQTPISQKKISENAESLFSENYREQDEPIGDAVVDENAIRRGETEMAPYYPAAVAGAKYAHSPSYPPSSLDASDSKKKVNTFDPNGLIVHGNLVDSYASSGNSPESLDIFNPEDPQDEAIPNEKPIAGAIKCNSDKKTGVFTGGFEVKLNCNLPGKIYYCVSVDGPCDPLDLMYTHAISIGPSDNEYFFSFYGISSEGKVSAIVDEIFTIDSSLPSLSTSFPKLYFQTTEAPVSARTQSLDFGKENHFYSKYNFGGHNPGIDGLGWNCADIITNYAALSSPQVIVIDENFDTSSLSESFEIEESINLAGLSYGNNYITTVLEDRTRYLSSCETQNIILKDFSIFSFLGISETPLNPYGVRKTQGGFSAYSYFEDEPTPNKGAGKAESLRAPASLEGSFMGITN